VVTGGASGIGEAVAKRIASEGGKVAIWDLNGGIKVDISDYASVEKATAETIKQIGGIDILVNSAGITGPTVPLIEFPIDGWKQVIDINLNGAFYCNRAVAPHMVAQNYGRIVNIASIAGKEGNPNASGLLGLEGGRDRHDQVARQGIG
jgi:3-oxoacyl-[acyl-carrier protein] reductase